MNGIVGWVLVGLAWVGRGGWVGGERHTHIYTHNTHTLSRVYVYIHIKFIDSCMYVMSHMHSC